MKSMTGYGSSEIQNERYLLAIEIKSYNNRYLDIAFNAPSYLSCYEPQMKELIKRVSARGHIDVNIKLKRLESQVEVLVDRSVVLQYQKALHEIRDLVGITEEPRLSHFLHADDVLKTVRANDASVYEQPLLQQLSSALARYAVTKEQEGKATFDDITEQLRLFEQGLQVVKEHAQSLEDRISENLIMKFEQLLGEEYDRSRVLQEVAVMLMKYTINEEIQRIESHVKLFRDDMVQERPIGKRLDFLCQELNREINTIASKSIIVEVNQAVVVMKDSLENIREQLRNIE
jgi:uncharacterized protein (TIGR00255 family)